MHVRCAGSEIERQATAGLLAYRRHACVVPPIIAHAACSVQLAGARLTPCMRKILLQGTGRYDAVWCAVCSCSQPSLWLQGAQIVTGYFPAGKWYNLFDNSSLLAHGSGSDVTLTLPLGEVGVHQQGGTILALAQPSQRAGG